LRGLGGRWMGNCRAMGSRGADGDAARSPASTRLLLRAADAWERFGGTGRHVSVSGGDASARGRRVSVSGVTHPHDSARCRLRSATAAPASEPTRRPPGSGAGMIGWRWPPRYCTYRCPPARADVEADSCMPAGGEPAPRKGGRGGRAAPPQGSPCVGSRGHHVRQGRECEPGEHGLGAGPGVGRRCPPPGYLPAWRAHA
jgi:hypothetical protein